MSNEILAALMQLFAIIAKQDGQIKQSERDYVHNFLKKQVDEDTVNTFLKKFDDYAKISVSEDGKIIQSSDESSRISVKDSVRTLLICKKINKQLDQKQKIIVLVRLYEIIFAEQSFTEDKKTLINTVANSFNISDQEKGFIEDFVFEDEVLKHNNPNLVVIDSNKYNDNKFKHLEIEKLDGHILILNIPSVNLYFLRYTGKSDLNLNGLIINNNRIHLFATGCVVKLPKSKPIFYTDIVEKIISEKAHANFAIEVNNLEFKFPNGHVGLRNINFSETSGKLIGIMGVSGAGKTTMLNVLAGIETPSNGNVKINGIDVHKEKEQLQGMIGYIPQDDLLIEELSVFDNLYFTAKLCLKDLSEEEITDKVHQILTSLSLIHIKDLKVGSPMNKKISGGQRKRLNIGLELIREPAVLFVDEPTSGLSSKDSDNVIELLRELALKGKLIFVVIHQPSSDIYKMFDNMLFLDNGGYLVYYGNPVESIIYFKELDNQVNSKIGECSLCGNANPEEVFHIMEAKIIDEYGLSVGVRKVKPHEWAKHFEKDNKPKEVKRENAKLPSLLNPPHLLKQFSIFFKRDILSKLANTQYILINALETPVLAFILASIIKYTSDTGSGLYIFRENDNIAPYIFMSVIVMIFVGLTVSAEEIFRDRMILKRESLLNLSKGSYLFSKLSILIFISAIQSLLFVLIGNEILGIKSMLFEYWLVLFSIGVSSNILGLNISATFNSAVTIYIIIPLLIIPQMILGGAMFSYDKLNKNIGGGDGVPFIAELMPSKWAYEGLIVNQFINNNYNKDLYESDKQRSICNYKTVYYIPELENIIDKYNKEVKSNVFIKNTEQVNTRLKNDITLLNKELKKELAIWDKEFTDIDKVSVKEFNPTIANEIKKELKLLKKIYKKKYRKASSNKNKIIKEYTKTDDLSEIYQKKFDDYSNEYISRLVKNSFSTIKILRKETELVQKIDPIYKDAEKHTNIINSHFYAPRKLVFGNYINTYTVNVMVIWMFSLILFITLYFNLFNVLLNMIDKSSSKLIKTLRIKSKE